MPFWPAASRSGASVPKTTTRSAASPSEVAISISGTFPSGVAPGPKTPPRWSSVSCSVVPAFPTITIESVFVVVAPPHDAGTAPKWSSAPTTTRVAEPPAVTDALNVRDTGSYVHDSARAIPGSASAAAATAATTTILLKSSWPRERRRDDPNTYWGTRFSTASGVGSRPAS